MQSYPEGVYCSAECHDRAAEASVRLAKIQEDEKALAEWKQRQMAYKIITYVVVGFVIFFSWDHLPTALTDHVEEFWKAMKGFMKTVFP